MNVRVGHHFSLGDAGIKLHLVRRMTADNLAKGLIGFLAMTQFSLDLSQQKPLSGTLYPSALVLDHLLQIGHSLLVFLHVDIIVGIGVVPVFHSPEVHRVTTHIADHVLCVVFPVELCIAFCQPGLRQSVH